MLNFALTSFAVFTGLATAPVQYFPVPGNTERPFSEAVRVGDTLYLSGQLGIRADGALPDGFEAQAKQMMENIGATLARQRLGWGDVFHCTVMLDDMADWPAFNAIYVPYFPKGRLPARSALGADGLALGARIEMECQAYAGKR
ncbi:MAG: RidA family protein [Proteobacteria bacterium]|nr:RidA family protein [Pseudomonadota bacterium]